MKDEQKQEKKTPAHNLRSPSNLNPFGRIFGAPTVVTQATPNLPTQGSRQSYQAPASSERHGPVEKWRDPTVEGSKLRYATVIGKVTSCSKRCESIPWKLPSRDFRSKLKPISVSPRLESRLGQGPKAFLRHAFLLMDMFSVDIQASPFS